jgi:hypothetical protein
MALCQGRVPGRPNAHGMSLARCEKCGHVGCRDPKCSNALVDGFIRCVRCNSNAIRTF